MEPVAKNSAYLPLATRYLRLWGRRKEGEEGGRKRRRNGSKGGGTERKVGWKGSLNAERYRGKEAREERTMGEKEDCTVSEEEWKEGETSITKARWMKWRTGRR